MLFSKQPLSRREREIMDILYRLGEASAAEIHQSLSERPSYSAVRGLLRVLEEKGHVRHREKNLRYVYLPVVPREKASRSAIAHVVDTFFDGSAEQAVATLLDVSAQKLTDEDFERLSALIEKARKEGR